MRTTDCIACELRCLNFVTFYIFGWLRPQSCNALDEHSTQTVQSISEVENVLATSPSPLFYQLEDAVLLEGVLVRTNG